MIPINFIAQWRQQAPWVYQSQIEQDLVLSRALVELYQHTVIQNSLAFRGGTALNKLFVKPAARYSEDLDFVLVDDAPIGHIFSAIREALDPWLGTAKWKQTARSAKLIYRFSSEDEPPVPLRVKIEINTVEAFNLYGYRQHNYSVESRWFSGSSQIRTYNLEELMGTKLRALYQRSKGRDLFDLWLSINQLNVNCSQVLEAFQRYNAFNQTAISRAELEKNLTFKMRTSSFNQDVGPLLAGNIPWNPETAYRSVMSALVSKLPGEPWKNLDEHSENLQPVVGEIHG
ncbi:MAG: nucleotidyl transferase AbiEii/AbiGii toxin family protein [Pseudomonadota bacterium]